MLEKFFTTHLFCCITRQTDKQNNKTTKRIKDLGGKGCGRGTSCYIPHLDPIMFLFFIIHLFFFYLSYPNECQGRITYTLFGMVIGICDWMWHVHRIDIPLISLPRYYVAHVLAICCCLVIIGTNVEQQLKEKTLKEVVGSMIFGSGSFERTKSGRWMTPPKITQIS